MPAVIVEALGISFAALFVAMTARKLASSRPLLPDLLRELLACDLCTSFWSTIVVVLAWSGTSWGGTLERAPLIPTCAGLTFALVRWTARSAPPPSPTDPPSTNPTI